MPRPLNEFATGTFDASGTAAARLGPTNPNNQWHITGLVVQTSTAALKPVASVYVGGPSATAFAVSYSGSGDRAGTDIVLWPGQYLTVVWTGGDPGATATIQVTGEIPETALPARAVVVTPFANPVTSAAAATPFSSVAALLYDSGTLSYATIAMPMPGPPANTSGPIDVSQWPTAIVYTAMGTPHDVGISWWREIGLTNIIAATSVTQDTGNISVPRVNVGPYLRLTANQNAAVATTGRLQVWGSRFSIADLRQILVGAANTANFLDVALNIGAGATNTRTSLQRYMGGASWYMVSSAATAWTAKLYTLDLAGAEALTVDRFVSAAAGQTAKILQVPSGRLRLDLTNNGAGAANFWATLIPYTQ